jgi:methyl-accepting chemotaxis protein
MNHLSSATQQTASASEELSATAEELSAQATQLQQLMASFRLREDEQPASAMGSRPAASRAAADTHAPAAAQGSGTTRQATPRKQARPAPQSTRSADGNAGITSARALAARYGNHRNNAPADAVDESSFSRF